MKVLMVPSWYPTPAGPLLGTFYKEQAEAMAARGVEMAVAHVSVGSDFRPRSNGIRRQETNGVLTYIDTRPNLTPRWEKGRCAQRTRMLERLYRCIETEWGRPDVVNLRSSLHGYEAIALCKKHCLPLFFMEHSSYVLTEGEESAARARLCEVMRAASVSACVSSALRDAMLPYGEVRVIPDPVDGEHFYPKEQPPHDGFLFRAMGQLRPIKNYGMLIRAFARLKNTTTTPVFLEIAGTGALRGSLQAEIDAKGIGGACRLVGAVPREKAADFMNGCDCFVCSSRLETLSCVLNEAAACGKPVISTRCGGPLDIVTAKTGILVPEDDEESMATAMQAMMLTAFQYDAQAIRRQTLERFGTDAVCEKLIGACRDAMKAD